ncbi:MAG: MOSC domain-containing protein [Proteobacteria bacterium]|nr:MOSC domain-containing protein [Pseudomonadota bacterium]
MATITGIFRYPVKGLTPEPLASVALARGATLPGDRRFAIENGPAGFDPTAPAYLPKIRFLMLMRNESLARLDARFDDATQTLVLRLDGIEVARGDLSEARGRAAIEAFFATYCGGELRGPPRLLQAPGHSFSDVAAKVVSIINLSSVAAIAAAVGAPVDMLRFRANFYVSGWPAWHEFDLVGEELRIGRVARLKVVKRIVRCAATNVDPSSGKRDLTIPRTLHQAFGHDDCGVYAEVMHDGSVDIGDAVAPTRGA